MIERATLELLEERLTLASCPEEVFGELRRGSDAERRSALRSVYAGLSHSCHPDLAAVADRPLADRTFARLAEWKQQAETKIASGAYGDRRPAAPEVELTVRGKRLILRETLGEGTFATVRAAIYEGYGDGVFAKIARDPADNDLLSREHSTLRRIREMAPESEIEAFLSRQRVYVPEPLTAFSIPGGTGEKHRATLLRVPNARCFTAQTLRKEKFPNGLEPKHVHWIFRRLLLTLWMAHLRGIVHGAVTPDHVLVFPEEHGIVLLDWTCSAERGEEHIPAYDPAFGDYCPPELLKRAPAEPTLDLYMAGATAIHMLGGDPIRGTIPAMVPSPIAAAYLRCLASDPRRRPQDAEAFHNEFGQILESVYGRRAYSHLTVP